VSKKVGSVVARDRVVVANGQRTASGGGVELHLQASVTTRGGGSLLRRPLARARRPSAGAKHPPSVVSRKGRGSLIRAQPGLIMVVCGAGCPPDTPDRPLHPPDKDQTGVG
jgi:hypothetical protein